MSIEETLPGAKVDETPNRDSSGDGVEAVRTDDEVVEDAQTAEAGSPAQGGPDGQDKQPIFNWRRLLGSITVKDILGILGVVGSVVGYILKLEAIYFAGIVFVSCLFLLIWGLLQRKNESRTLRAFALLALIVGAVGCIYFASVGVTLLAGAPARIGNVVETKTDVIELKKEGVVELVNLNNYHIKFAHPTDYAKTSFSVAPESADDVKKLNLIYKKQPEHEGKVFQSGLTIEVNDPGADFEVPVTLMAELKQKVQNPSVKVRVEQQYTRRNWLWRFRTWVYERYS